MEVQYMKKWLTIPKDRMELCVEEAIAPIEGEIKVRVTKTFISSTDTAVYLGEATSEPMVPCRIAVGLISESPENKQFIKGERVLLTPYIKNEGQAPNAKGVDIDGYLSNYVIVPESNIIKLPDSVDDESALFAEYIAIGLKAFHVLKIEKQEYVTIFGCDALSIILSQIAIYNKTIPIIIGKNDTKLQIAKDCGAYYTINLNQEKVTQRVKSITSGKNVGTALFTFTDTMSTNVVLNTLRYRGKLGAIGFNTLVDKALIDLRLVFTKSLSIYGISDGIGYIEKAINLLANQVISIKPLISNTIKFEEVGKFIKNIDNKEDFLKIIIDCYES